MIVFSLRLSPSKKYISVDQLLLTIWTVLTFIVKIFFESFNSQLSRPGANLAKTLSALFQDSVFLNDVFESQQYSRMLMVGWDFSKDLLMSLVNILLWHRN